MFDKGKREQRHEQEDATFNKMLLWLIGAVGAELLIVLFKKIYVDFIAGATVARVLNMFFQVFSFLGAALIVAGIVWAVLSRRKGDDVTVPCACTAAAAGLWVLSALSYFLYDFGMSILMLLPAAGAVLIVVYFLYQRIFFFNTVLTAGGLIVLWLYRQYFLDHPTVIRLFFVAEFALLAAGLALGLLLRRSDGRLGGLQVVPSDTDYLMTYITCMATALTLILALVLDTAVIFYLLFALVAWVFVQAVFFTVQLM